MTLGEALIELLESYGVDTVFGIPGVHTVELYRGLAHSKIRHITPRHEQGAGFMADGYARASGKPGVAFVITGPGLTNTITAMAQARADSVPMLVISGVNAMPTLGRGLGFLHELPDQRGMLEKVALSSERVTEPSQLPGALSRAFALFAAARPGPVHIEVPIDVMGKPANDIAAEPSNARPPEADPAEVEDAARMLAAAKRPLILAGGGAKRADAALRALAERADAPVVTTANGRGLLHRHALGVPASPSLKSVRALMAESDCVLAAGTEFGPTDYDMYADGGFVLPANLIRVDVGQDQLQRRPVRLGLQTTCEAALPAIVRAMSGHASKDGAARAERARQAAWAEIGPPWQAQALAVEAIRDALPGAVIVGDSTQPIYAANLYYDHDRPGRFFSAATGYGALGYGPPAAVGAAIALPDAPVVCLTGDGGFQFTLAEIGAAVEAGTNVIYLVWNNRGYREIEESMRSAGVEPVGVSPLPPDFTKIAEAYGVPAERIAAAPGEIAQALKRARSRGGVALVEIAVD